VVDPGRNGTVFRQSAAISRFSPYFKKSFRDQAKFVGAKLSH